MGEPKISRNHVIIVVLSICLAVSLFFNGYLAWRLQTLTGESSSAFTFLWSPEEQGITSDWLQMNASFVWDENDLYVVVKINYTALRGSYLGLVFDRNENGKIDYQSMDDLPYILFMDNTTYPTTALLSDGRLAMLKMASIPSNDTCIFDLETGYTFTMKFPSLMRHLGNKLVHVVFEDVESGVAKKFVVKRFSFG